METLSTTNPISPTGGTNTSVPLGITASTELKPFPLNSPMFDSDLFSTPRKILIDSFIIKNNQDLYDSVYEWAVRDNKLDFYWPKFEEPKVTPWNLLPAYYSKQTRMEYQLLFYPVKVTNCKVKLDAIIDYVNNLSPVEDSTGFANQNNQFELDDPDGIINFPVPQYYVTNNVNTDMNFLGGGNNLVFPAFVPETKVRFSIANPYHNNNLQPDSFNVLVYLIATPVNPQNLVGKRIAQYSGAFYDLIPYFYCKTSG